MMPAMVKVFEFEILAMSLVDVESQQKVFLMS